MAGYATDTTIETVYVRLPDGTYIRVELTHDGVNEDAEVGCYHEEDNSVVALDRDHYSYSRAVLTDGIEQEDDDGTS